MPYKRNADAPDSVRALPDDAITIWRKAFNAALEQYGDEETASKVAWAAVKVKYRQEGDEWVLKEGVELSHGEVEQKLGKAIRMQVAGEDPSDSSNVWLSEVFDDFAIFTWDDQFYRADYTINDEGNVALSNVVKVVRVVSYEALAEGSPRSVLLTNNGPITVLTEETENGNKLFRVRGVALRDDVVSANGYYYSREANERILEETNTYIGNGGKSTMFSRHERAKYGLPVGKIERLERSGKVVFYEAIIANTNEGKDVQVLITEGVLGPTSIRSTDFEVKPMRVNGRQVMAVVRATIHGIDLVEQASIEGAGITEILTEGAIVEEVEIDMDWKEVSLADVRSNRPDLLEEFDRQKYDGVNVKVRKLEEALAAAEARSKELEEGHQAALTTLEAEREAAIAQAVEEAKAPLLEQVATFTAQAEQHALDAAIAGAVKGKAHPELLEAALRNGLAFGEGRVEACAQAEDVTEERVKAAEGLVASMKQALLVEGALRGADSARGQVDNDDAARLTEAQSAVLEMSA